ncbi:MAG: hypothetical protein KGI66_04495, partial [Patescibacteria group bacterium]|nr:hypothetical protein [Patescibacteria group bacterium]
MQTSSATTWTITHNLDSRAVVTQCFDSNWTLLTPSSLVNTDLNTTTVTFSVAETGSCVSQIAGPLVIQSDSYALALNPTSSQVVSGSYLTTFNGPVAVNGAFTGSAVTANSLQGKMTDTGGQVYNVIGDGCVADGITDDTTCIQTAVAAAESTGGSVLFPPGTYKVTSGIVITAPVRLDCSPSASTTFVSTITSGAVFTFEYGVPSSGGAASGIYGCSFQGPGLSNVNSVAVALGSGTLSTTGAVSPVLSNVSIGSATSATSGFGVGIQFVSSGYAYGAQITNPQIFNCAIAIDLYGNNNVISAGSLSSNQTGLLVDGGAPNVSVSNTTFDDNSVYGININTATSLTTSNLQFGNPAMGSYTAFIYYGAASSAANITGGTMSESRTTGTQAQFILITAASDIVNVSGVDLKSSGATVTYALHFSATSQKGRLILINNTPAQITDWNSSSGAAVTDIPLGQNLAFNPSVAAAIQWVAVGGSDSNDGTTIATAKASVSAAVSALPACASYSHCGTVDVTAGTYTFTSTIEIPNEVSVKLESAAELDCNITTGLTPCVLMDGSDALYGSDPTTSILSTTATTSATALLQVGPTSPQVQTFVVHDLYLYANNASKTAFSTALVYVPNGGQPSLLQNIVMFIIQGAAFPGLWMTAGGDGGFALNNIEVNGGAPPCKFSGTSSPTLGDFPVYNLTCEHATNTTTGSTANPQVLIDGGTTDYVHDIDFYHLVTEGLDTDASAQSEVVVNNAFNIHFYGFLARPSTLGTAYALDLTGTSALNYGNTAFGISNYFSHNVINDEVASRTWAGNYITSWTQSTTSLSTAATAIAKLDQSAPNQWAGRTACSGGTKTLTFSYAGPAAPVVVVSDETTAGGARVSALSTTSA